MNTKKKAFTLIEIAIVVVILGILAVIVISQLTQQETKPIKVLTIDGEDHYDLNTLEQTQSTEQQNTKTLRLEFNGVKNGWIEISGQYPEEHADRVKTAKSLAVLKGILTKEELSLFYPSSRLELDHKTIVTLTR